jgi:hypothetical protein
MALVLGPFSERIENEEVIPRINSVVDLEGLSPYPRTGGVDYWARVEKALRLIPPDKRFPALCAFSSVIYLGERLLDEAWKHLLRELERRFELDAENILEKAFVLAEDSANHRRFLHCNAIRGRLDVDRHPRSNTLGDVAKDLLLGEFAEELRGFANRDYWVILCDNALSGESLKSEIEKTRIVTDYIGVQPQIIVLVQVFTDEANRCVSGELRKGVEILHSIRLDDRFRVNSENCRLFKDADTLAGVRELCEWFYGEKLQKDPDYDQTIQVGGENLRAYGPYGFRNTGLTLVTPNCPSNSLPILWYSEQGAYEAPYPRVESRISQAKSRDKYYLELLRRRKKTS